MLRTGGEDDMKMLFRSHNLTQRKVRWGRRASRATRIDIFYPCSAQPTVVNAALSSFCYCLLYALESSFCPVLKAISNDAISPLRRVLVAPWRRPARTEPSNGSSFEQHVLKHAPQQIVMSSDISSICKACPSIISCT